MNIPIVAKSAYLKIKNKVCKMDWQDVMFLIIAVIGIFVRIYSFGSNPPGLNADEASIGYDAYALLNFGVDRNGVHNPVHFIAWGSGQNALYAYFSMPFIYLFGLTPFSVRMVNLLFGIISLFIFYLLIKKITTKEIALIAYFLLAVNPWHIMMCRWALESNLFPAVFLIGVYFMVLSVERKVFLPLSAFTFALSLYSYGISYFFIPLFLFIVLEYLLFYRKIKLFDLGVSSIVFVVTALPIFLFVIINYLKLESIQTPLFTIPRLTGDAQFMTQSSIFNKDFFSKALQNFMFFIKYFITQEDVIWNVMPNFGFMYLFSLPFVLLGFIKLIIVHIGSTKFRKSFILLIWFIVSVLLTFTIEICTNRINIIFFPVIFFASLGIFYIKNRLKKYPVPALAVILYIVAFSLLTLNKPSPIASILFSIPIIVFGTIKLPGKKVEAIFFRKVSLGVSWLSLVFITAYALYKNGANEGLNYIVIALIVAVAIVIIKDKAVKFTISVTILYFLFFTMFSYKYFTEYPKAASPIFYESFGEAINYASDHWDGKIYVTDKVNMPYIFVLFYQKTDPKMFQNTVKYFNPGGTFQNVQSFGRYTFQNMDANNTENAAYVIHNSDLNKFNTDEFEIYNFKLYSVIIKKKD